MKTVCTLPIGRAIKDIEYSLQSLGLVDIGDARVKQQGACGFYNYTVTALCGTHP